MSNRRRRPRKTTPTRKRPTTTRTTTTPTTGKRTNARRKLEAIVARVAATAGRMYRSVSRRQLVAAVALVVVAFLLGLLLAPDGDSNQPAQAPPAAIATGAVPGTTPGTEPATDPTTGPALAPGIVVRSELGDFSLVQPWTGADDCPSVAQWEELIAAGELVECTLFALPQAHGTLTPGTRLVFLGYQSGADLQALLLLPDGPQGACRAGTVVSVPVDGNWQEVLRALGRAPASWTRPAIPVPSGLRCAAGAAR